MISRPSTVAPARPKPTARADPTAVKPGAGAMAAARAVPFYGAEELTHQFERLTSEEEGLLKERRALKHDLKVAEDEDSGDKNDLGGGPPGLPNPNMFVNKWPPQKVKEAETIKLREIIESSYKVEGDLRREVNQNIKMLMDIGCYCISLSRFIFDGEPEQVLGIVEYDPEFRIDRLASGSLAGHIIGAKDVGDEGLVDLPRVVHHARLESHAARWVPGHRA